MGHSSACTDRVMQAFAHRAPEKQVCVPRISSPESQAEISESPAQTVAVRVYALEVTDMGKSGLLISLLAVCLLGGCTIVRIVPPVQGSVVDAATGVPIQSASVKIKYLNSSRTARTDSQGRFSFPAKHNAYCRFINVHVDRDSWFSLHVEADGYQAFSTREDSVYSISRGPFEHETRPHRLTWTGKAILVDPVRLTAKSGNGL